MHTIFLRLQKQKKKHTNTCDFVIGEQRVYKYVIKCKKDKTCKKKTAGATIAPASRD